MQPERRGHGRNLAVEIQRKTPVIDLTILNLSTSGMAVELSQALTVGSSYPFTMSQRKDRISVNGLVEWCRFAGTLPLGPGEHRPIYKAGISFTKIHTSEPTGIWTELKIASNPASGASPSDA